MLFVFVALMVAGLIGIIVCQKKQKTNPNAQTIAFLFLILILVGAGGTLYETGIFGGDREMEQIMGNEITFAKARSQVLAEYAGQKWNGQTAVILVEPGNEKNQIAKAGLETMEAALKKAGLNVTVDTLNIPQSEEGEPAMLNAKIYNEAFAKNKAANVFVLMASLPFDPQEVSKLDCWKFDPKKARVIVTNAEIANLKPAIAKGLVGAAIASKSGYDPEKPAPKDYKAAFDARYILITPENLKEVIAKRGDLFAK